MLFRGLDLLQPHLLLLGFQLVERLVACGAPQTLCSRRWLYAQQVGGSYSKFMKVCQAKSVPEREGVRARCAASSYGRLMRLVNAREAAIALPR